MRDISRSRQYLDFTYKLINGTTNRPPTISLLHLCGAHVIKNIASDVKSNYSKSNFKNQQVYNRLLKNMLGLMFSIQDYDKMQEYWKNMSVLFVNEKFTEEEVTKALEYIKNVCNT
jgi:hypothetical protein